MSKHRLVRSVDVTPLESVIRVSVPGTPTRDLTRTLKAELVEQYAVDAGVVVHIAEPV